MSWLYEFFAMLSAILAPMLHELGIPNHYMIDAIIMFLIIPLTHLLNDEDTKQIIMEENWFQGIKYLLGLYKNPTALSNRRT